MDRAQSETVGTLLMTGMVVVVVGVGTAAVVFDSGGVTEETPLVDLSTNVTAQDVEITHEGGDVVDTEDVRVVLEASVGSERYRLDAANVSGDDEALGPGDELVREHEIGVKAGTVIVVHSPTDTVLVEEEVDVGVPGKGLPPSARFEPTPASPDPGEEVTIDAAAADDNDGSIASYEWAFGDGTTATTSDPTATHTYGSKGYYDVTLTTVDDEGLEHSRTSEIRVTDLRAPDDPEDTSGLAYEYYEADSSFTSLPAFDSLTPTRTGTTDQFDLNLSHREDDFAFRYTGYVTVPDNDTYTFYTTSDDGSQLYVGDELVVDNDGTHAATEKTGTIGLESGTHEINVTYFEHGGTEALTVGWDGENVSRQEIAATNLSSDSS